MIAFATMSLRLNSEGMLVLGEILCICLFIEKRCMMDAIPPKLS